MKIYKYSLLTTLGIIIITLVTIIMIINSTYIYQSAKSHIIEDMKNNSTKTILSLKSNISTLIESYSPNEYEKLIYNEIKNKDIFAIIIEDYKMGKVMGKESYITGKIKVDNSTILDYDIDNLEQKERLKNTFLSKSADITNSSNKILGKISIYITDDTINKELNRIIKDTIIDTIFLSIFLITFLFLSIKYYILKPISNIIQAMNNTNQKGIPNAPMPESTSKEINALSTSINLMVETIKESRNILEKNEHRLEYLLEMSPISIRITKRQKGKDYVIFSNKAYSKLMQLEKDDVYGMNPRDYYINNFSYETIEKTLKSGQSIYNMTIEVNIKNKIHWVLASYMNIEYDGENAVIGWFYDITKEKENEAKLFNALELQTTIFNNSGYMMISTDTNGIIKQFNKEAEKLLGYKAEEVIDKYTPELFHLESEIIQKATYFSKELNKKVNPSFEVFIAKTDLGLKNEYEWTYVSKKGDYIPVTIAVTSLKNKEDITYGYLGIVQDISQRKLIESQAKLASMGEMIGNIAHQWRQPLSMISTIASGIIVQNELLKDVPKDIILDMDKIMKQTKYLSQTIDDFRNFIKNTNQKEKVSIINAIKKALNILRPSIKNNDINLILKLEDDTEIDGFKNELIQSFINILNNAKDALKEKTILSDKFIFIETQNINNSLILIIKDNAGGIDKKIIHKIFEPYFTTKHKSIGTGIGLSMAHQIITEHHNATIEVFNSTYKYEEKSFTGAYFQITFNSPSTI